MAWWPGISLPMTKPLIQIQLLSKSYSVNNLTTKVLNAISLSIYPGELVAIVGASGSGKSTFMNILGLLDSWDEGDYWFQDKDVKAVSQDELARLRNLSIGFIFQQFNLLPRFSVKENIALPLRYRRIKKSDRDERVMQVLDSVGLPSFMNHYPNQLSGGQQQRIAIARALIVEPQLLLADEPTGALDSRTGAEILNLFLSLNQQGRTVIIVTHDEQVAKRCHRQIHLVDGQMMDENRG